MEGVPAQRKVVAFDEAAAARGTAIRCDGDTVPPRGRGRVRRGPRKRTSEAASQDRTMVENTVAGRQRAEEPSIEAPPGPLSAPRASARGTALERAKSSPPGERAMDAAQAEAGVLSSSMDPIRQAHREGGQGGLPRISRRTATAQGESTFEASRSAARRRVASAGDRKHSSPQGARERSRLQKSVRCIFLAAPSRQRASAVWNAERGIARGDPAALDEAASGSQRATGCGAMPCA